MPAANPRSPAAPSQMPAAGLSTDAVTGTLSPARNLQFDGLRAIAVLLVFFHHWTSFELNLGIVGVQLFFVLSGFLITGILLDLRGVMERNGQSLRFSLGSFYARRGLRIVPLYYFCLFGFASLVYLNMSAPHAPILWHMLFLSNVEFFINGAFGGPFSHFWTLAVEEQFYLLWPFIVLLASPRALPRFVLSMILAAPCLRLLLFLCGWTSFAQYGTQVFSNFDSLGLGALAACVARSSVLTRGRFQRCLCLLAPVAALDIVLIRSAAAGALDASLDQFSVAIVSTWLVWNTARGVRGIAGRVLANPAMTYLGRISYGLYLWHLFAPPFVRKILSLLGLPAWMGNGIWGFFLSFLWTVAAASVTWFFLEQPINRLKRYFPYRKRTEIVERDMASSGAFA